MTSTSEVLNKAADLIEERGWTRGGGWQYADAEFLLPVCAEGAIQAATASPFRTIACAPASDEIEAQRNCPAYKAVSEYLGTSLLYVWNDAESRTATEVIEVLRAAAVIEAARESKPAEVRDLGDGTTLEYHDDGQVIHQSLLGPVALRDAL